MKRQKLSDKLSLLYAALFGIVFFLLSAGVLFCTYEALSGDKREYLQHMMPLVESHILEEIAEGDAITDGDLLMEQAYDLNLNMIVYSPEGIIVNKLYNFPMQESELPRELDKVHTVFTEQYGILLSYRSSLYDGDTHLGSILLVSNPVNEVGYIKLLGILLLAANGVGIVAAAFVGRYVSRKMLAPIDSMIHEAGKIDSRHLKKRLPVPEPDDELRRLAVTINRMLARVEDAFNQQSRFTADASHELRTPLAVIRGYTDILQRWGKDDKNVLQEGIAAISKQTEYMHKLVENLLFLARGEREKLDVNKAPFQVEQLMKELTVEQSALDNRHQYLVEAEPGLAIFGDRTMIKQLLLAVIDNSKKFTPQGGSITLAAKKTEGGTELSVADTGIGMEPEQLEHIFERFYRADKARSRKDGSAGLGLSIASAIADVHGAEIGATSSPNEGTRIMVLFPNQSSALDSQ
jgi:two-component system sensor histidine kinase ArlS